MEGDTDLQHGRHVEAMHEARCRPKVQRPSAQNPQVTVDELVPQAKKAGPT